MGWAAQEDGRGWGLQGLPREAEMWAVGAEIGKEQILI